MKNVNLVKSIFSHTQKALFMSLVLILLVTTGCQNSDELKTKNEIISSEKYSNIPVEETTSFEGFVSLYSDLSENHPAYVPNRSLDDITKVRVDFTAMPIFLPKDHPRYDELYEMIAKSKEYKAENLFKTTVGGKSANGMIPIINIEKLPPERQQELWKNHYDPKLEGETERQNRSK